MLRENLYCRRLSKLLLFPGFCCEGVLRVLGAVMTATPVLAFSPWARDEPFLMIGKTPIAHLGPALFLSSRLLLTFVLLLVVLRYFPGAIEAGFSLPLLDKGTLETGELHWESIRSFGSALVHLPRQLGLHQIFGWLFLYIAVGFFIASGFTGREYLVSLYVVVVLHVVAYAAGWLGLGFGFFTRGQLIQFFYNSYFWSVFSVLAVLTGFTVFVLGLVAAARGLWALLIPNDRPRRKS